MLNNLPDADFQGKDRRRVAREPLSAAPRLEELESRLVPATFSATGTNASVQFTPNLFNLTVTETVHVTVSNVPLYNSLTGATLPVPSGTPTPAGTVSINLNNQTQQATLDSSGHATATFTASLFSLFTGQSLNVLYNGTASGSTLFVGSSFNAPLYLNYDNLLYPATINFNPLTPQQMAATTTPFNSVNGETDDFGFFAFQYADPGLITGVTAFGFSFPASTAAQLGAYGPQFMSS